MKHVTLIQGGGVGLDQAPAVQRILQAAGAAIAWDEHPAGHAAVEKGLSAFPEAMLQSVRANGVALKTKLLSAPGEPNFNVKLRAALGLFASIRPLKNLPGLPARFHDVNMLVLREITEDLYAAIEHEIVPGVVQSLKVVTEAASRRFFHFAFEHTRATGRHTIHCVHKANILKLGDGLFLDVFRDVARGYPDVTPREMIVDNCCQQLVTRPRQFDVLVMGNLYGDLVSDLGAGIVGGISATAGINVGDGIRVFETFHGGRREEVGLDRANPLPLLLPALELLDALGQVDCAQRIRRAMEKILVQGDIRTPDLGGQATTTAMTDAIVAAL